MLVKCGSAEARELASMVVMSHLFKSFENIRVIRKFNIMLLVKRMVTGIWISINLKELK